MTDEELTPEQIRAREAVHKMFHFILWERGVTRANCPRCQTFDQRWQEAKQNYITNKQRMNPSHKRSQDKYPTTKS